MFLQQKQSDEKNIFNKMQIEISSYLVLEEIIKKNTYKST